MKILLLFLFLIVLIITGLAHEFWLSPQKFFFNIRETAHISFKVGENFTGENWKGNKSKVRQLWHYTPSEQANNLADKLTEASGDSLSLPLAENGTHMVAFQSTNSFIQLEATKFNAYLLDDGLSATEVYRKEHHLMDQPGREYYQRSVKTIIQVGEEPTNTCSKPTGLPLDIIPEKNPYAIPEKLSKKSLLKVKFRVLFKEKPLQNALVKVWFIVPGKPIHPEEYHTDSAGWITTQRHPGPFMVSCVHMEKNLMDTVADWQSYWGSLTFEYSQFFPKAQSH